jgi:hypothetical protein
VVAWIEGTADENLHLSAVTLGELQAGVEITRERDREKASEIENWIDQVRKPGTSFRSMPASSGAAQNSCTGGPTIYSRSRGVCQV